MEENNNSHSQIEVAGISAICLEIIQDVNSVLGDLSCNFQKVEGKSW